MKRNMTKLLTAALCVALLLTAFVVGAAADDTVLPTVVYVNGASGSNDNDGSTAEKAVATLEKAYALLTAVDNGVSTNAEAKGVVVLCGTVNHTTNFNIPSSGKATVTHAGMITITSKWGDEDYQDTAVLKTTKGDGLYWQAGGPTTLENIKLDAGSTHFRIYGGTDFTIGEGVSISNSTNFALCGGYCRIAITDPVRLTVLSGQIGHVTPVPYAESHGHCYGNNSILIGGTAKVADVLAGPVVKKNSGKAYTIASTTVTVAGNAVVGTFNNGGAGAVTSSTLVLAGGTVENAIQSANIVNTYLVISGLEGNVTIPTAPKYESVTVTNNSNIALTAALSSDIDLIVDAGSTVTLVEGDNHTYTGEGEVIYEHTHNWVLDPEKSTTGSCTQAGTNYYYCDLGSCEETKTESAGFVHSFTDGVCSGCGGRTDTVYVRDGGTGDGYTASTAVGSLEAAYEALLSHTNIETNANAAGKIIFCGRLTVNDHFNYSLDYTHAGTITYTGEGYNGVLEIYAAQKSDLSVNDEHRFQFGGPTILKELTIDRGSASAGVSLTFYTGTSLVIEETVDAINTNWKGSYVEPIAGLTDAQIATMELSAHRGFQPMGPENSILSFTAAGKLGFAYIETDVYQTSDGQLICLHDSTLDRTTNGTGDVMNMTYAQILQYRIDTAAYGFDITTADEKDLYVPTFREYLEICHKYGCKPFIEIKDYREDTIHKIIDMALEYFEAEDIVMSCGSLSALQTSYAYNKDVFHHLIWGDTSDAGYTNSISVLSGFTNTAGETYAGIAFNIQNLHLEDNFNTAKSWIQKANAAGLQTCLRGADNMVQVRKMFELGIDYYPTNTTYPEKLQELKQGTEGGYSFAGVSGGKLFIRGGSRVQETTGDISITLLGGIFDMVAPSNAEGTCTGSYSVTVGGNAFVSRLVAGETNTRATGDRASSTVTVQGDATVKNLYLAGDAANVQAMTVNLLGGKVESITERRENKTGTVDDLTVNVASPVLMPEILTISNSCITGTKVLTIGGTGELGNAAAWDKLIANDGAAITLTGTYPEDLERVGSGKFLVNDQSITFGTIEVIEEDGAAVELGTDLPCDIVGNGTVLVTWYKDNEGKKGEALTGAPVSAGTYWVGVAVAEGTTDNEALVRTAVAEQLTTFTIVHDLTEVEAKEPTASADGNIAYWYCPICDKYFSNAAGTNEIRYEDTILKATAKLGDADGDGAVDAFDAVLIKKYSAGIITENDLNLSACDLDGDGYVDSYDAALVQRFSVGIIDKFPVEN